MTTVFIFAGSVILLQLAVKIGEKGGCEREIESN